MIPILSKQTLRAMRVPTLPYLNIYLRVTIAEKYVFTNVESIEINNSLESLTDTALVVIPRVFLQKIDKSKELKAINLIDVINLDDKIKIEIGYENDLETEFEGYITTIKDSTPVTLECKDEMYKLEIADKINATFRNADVKDILKKIAPTYKIETFKVFQIGKFAIENARPYEVLMQLKNMHIRTFFKDGVLCAGLPINLQGFKVHQFNPNYALEY